MNKIIAKDFRQTKAITLPMSGVTIEVYQSLLVSDLSGITKVEDEMQKNLDVICKCIKSWNLYTDEKQEQPDPITPENMNKLPAPDYQYLVKEMEVFSTEQKKN